MTASHSAQARFLSLADVAEVLNVDLGVVRELVESNELEAIRIGEQGAWRVERNVLEMYIDDLYERRRRVAQLEQLEFVDLPEFAQPRRHDSAN